METQENTKGGLPIFQIMLAILALGIIGSGFWQLRGLDQLIRQQQERFLAGILNERRDAVIHWLHAVRDDVELLSADPSLQDLVQDVGKRLGQDRKLIGQQMRQVFGLEIVDEAERQASLGALKLNGYSAFHARWHPWFRSLNERRGYYDFFLFDADGFLMYTVEKEDDYGTNLVSGKWSGTGLGVVAQDVLSRPKHFGVSIADFDAYGPSNGDAASFVASAIRGADGEILGGLAIQMPRDKLNAILNARMGTDGGGRFYLTGSDGFLRTDIGDSATLLMRRGISPFSVTGLGADEVMIIPRRRGVLGNEVVIAARTLSLEKIEFTIVAEFDMQLIRSWLGNSDITMVILSIVVGIILLLVVVVAWPRQRRF